MRISLSCLGCIALLTLPACDPNVETRGHLKDPDWQAQITPERTTRDEVYALLGSPSSRSSFGEETWYYVTTKRESFAFLKPEVADQEVVQVAFNPDGTVRTVAAIGKDKARDIAFSRRVTPTEGHQMTFTEQVLGNVGRFNSPASRGSSSMNRRGRPY